MYVTDFMTSTGFTPFPFSEGPYLAFCLSFLFQSEYLLQYVSRGELKSYQILSRDFHRDILTCLKSCAGINPKSWWLFSWATLILLGQRCKLMSPSWHCVRDDELALQDCPILIWQSCASSISAYSTPSVEALAGWERPSTNHAS